MQQVVETSDAGDPLPCNLCGSARFTPVFNIDRHGRYLATQICESCGLVRSNHLQDKQGIKDFYSIEYRKEYKGITRPKKKHVYRDARSAMKRYRFLQDIVKRNDRVLDVGAGTGIFVYCLQRLGFSIAGVEPDENHSRYARERLGVDVKTGFAEDMKEKAAYDVITLHHVLEHMDDPLTELKHLKDLLKPNG